MFVHAAGSKCHYATGESLNAAEKPRSARLALWWCCVSHGNTRSRYGERVKRRLRYRNAQHHIWAADKTVCGHVERADYEPERADAEGPVLLGNCTANGCKQNPWHAKY